MSLTKSLATDVVTVHGGHGGTLPKTVYRKCHVPCAKMGNTREMCVYK